MVNWDALIPVLRPDNVLMYSYDQISLYAT